jgi:hypothetical protein
MKNIEAMDLFRNNRANRSLTVAAPMCFSCQNGGQE